LVVPSLPGMEDIRTVNRLRRWLRREPRLYVCGSCFRRNSGFDLWVAERDGVMILLCRSCCAEAGRFRREAMF
jgi:hypothetical protein